ncbi:MAG: ABC transporter ATP-binding protein, partial [Phycisphaerae bacterium]
VLLDEPTAGLDPKGRVQFRQLLTSLREQGKALIVSSHILADLHEYCTHIGIIEAGCMRQFGTVREVVTGQANNRCRYRLSLAQPAVKLASILESTPEVSDVRVDGRVATLEYVEDSEQAAALLAALVRRGLPVAAFGAIELNLEEAYLRAGIRQVD